MFIIISDFDNDGLDEILTAIKPDKIALRFCPDKSGMLWEETEILFPTQTGTAKAVCAADFDMDGRKELAVTCEHAIAPKSGVFILKNNQNNDDWDFVDVSGGAGIKFDRMEIFDMDSDGDLDILTCEERHDDRGLGVIWYKNPAR